MSGNEDESSQGGAGRREVAWRVFAAEYDDADFDYSESGEERAPNYVVTPTGARVNRLFVVGVLTEVEQVSDEVLRGRVVDPTGAFVLYAGQYQPDEMAFLERADPPMFVAVTGKARTFQPEDSDRVFTSVRPESINEVDAGTRDRWIVQTAEQTIARVSTFADALDSDVRGDALREVLEESGVDSGLASGVPLAIDHYGTTKGYLAAVRDLAIDSARVVAGEISADEVGPLDLVPDEGADDVAVDFDYSLDETADLEAVEGEAEPAESVAEADAEPAEGGAEADAEPAESVAEADAEPAEGVAEADAEPTEGVAGGTAETGETRTTASDDLGEAPTSTVGESAEAPEAEAETGEVTEDETGEAPVAEAEVGSGEAPEVEDAGEAAELQEEVGTDEPPTVEDEQDTSTEEAFEPETGGEDEEPDLGTAGAGDEMYEFDEEERKEVEEEYGLEFSSGTEVDSPEESDLEPPEPAAGAEPEGEPSDVDQHAEPTGEEVDADELQEVESAPGGTEEVVDSADAAPEGGETAAVEAPGASIAEDEVAESAAGSREEIAEGEDEAVESEEGAAESEEAEESGKKEAPEDLENLVMETMQDLNEGDGVEREMLLAAVVQEYDVTPADVEDALDGALMAGRCYESGEDTFKPI